MRGHMSELERRFLRWVDLVEHLLACPDGGMPTAELTAELEAYPAMEGRALADPAVAAVVALLLETDTTHRTLSPEEIEALAGHFRSRLHLSEAGASLSPEAARKIVEALEPTERVGVLRRMRELIFDEGHLARREARIMERVAQVLGLEP